MGNITSRIYHRGHIWQANATIFIWKRVINIDAAEFIVTTNKPVGELMNNAAHRHENAFYDDFNMAANCVTTIVPVSRYIQLPHGRIVIYV